MRPQVLVLSQLMLLSLWETRTLHALDRAEDLGVTHAMALMDQPTAERRRLDEKLATLNKKTEPLLWLQYAVARAAAEERGSSSDPAMQKEIDDMIQLALDLQRPDLHLRLLLAKAIVQGQQSRENVETIYQEALGICRAFPQLSCTEAYREYAYYLYLIDDFSLALDIAQKGINPQPDENLEAVLQQILLKDILAIILDTIEDRQRSYRLYGEVLNFAERHNLRQLIAIVAFNLGELILKDSSLGTLDEALNHYNRSIAVAQAIDDQVGLGWAYYGRGRYYLAVQDMSRAIEEFNKALDIFIKHAQHEILGSVFLKKAQALVELKRLDEAEETLNLAKPHIPTTYRSAWTDILEVQYRVAKGKDQMASTLSLLEQVYKERKELWKEEKQKRLEKFQTLTHLRVEEQRNAQLKADLKATQRIRDLSFGLAASMGLVLAGLVYIYRQTKKMADHRQKMQNILDVIDESILIINRQRKIEGIYGQRIKSLLRESDKDMLGQDISVILGDQGSDQAHVGLAVLNSCLGEDIMSWELNAHQLPHELRTDQGETVLDLHWQPILRQGLTAEVLLCIRDVTEKARAKASLQELNARAQMLAEVLSVHQERACRFLEENFEGVYQDILRRDRNDFQRKKIMMQVHTHKGLARTLGLKALASALHQLEELEKSDQPTMLQAWLDKDLAALLRAYREAIQILHHGDAKEELSMRILDLEKDVRRILLQRCLEENLPIGGLVFRDEWIHWTEAQLNLLEKVLVHAVQNSIDHGFVFPRLKGFEPRPVHLVIQAQRISNRLHFTVADNGKGLDLEALAEKAALSGNAARTLPFAPGLSTAPQTSLTSGRGLGMTAMRTLVEEAGGTLTMSNNIEGGASLVLKL